MNAITGNEDDLDPDTQAELKNYVYVLRDPRDQKVFYVGRAGGQGSQGNDRVLDHFREARSHLAESGHGRTAKTRRIIDIWGAGEDVEWFVVRRGLVEEGDNIASHLEAALLDLLQITTNGPALNVQNGAGSAAHGLLSADEVIALNTVPVAPTRPALLGTPVFIFPIGNTLDTAIDAYEATRGVWSVGREFRNMEGAIAVGVSKGVSRGVFQIDSWEPIGRKWRFTGKPIEQNELHVRSYLPVTSKAKGYWMRGNFLVVKFLNGARVQIVRGSEVREPQAL